METQLEEADWLQARFDQLNMIEEKRLCAISHAPSAIRNACPEPEKRRRACREVEGSGLVARYSSTLSGGEPGLEATCFEKGIAWLRYPVT